MWMRRCEQPDVFETTFPALQDGLAQLAALPVEPAHQLAAAIGYQVGVLTMLESSGYIPYDNPDWQAVREAFQRLRAPAEG